MLAFPGPAPGEEGVDEDDGSVAEMVGSGEGGCWGDFGGAEIVEVFEKSGDLYAGMYVIVMSGEGNSLLCGTTNDVLYIGKLVQGMAKEAYWFDRLPYRIFEKGPLPIQDRVSSLARYKMNRSEIQNEHEYVLQ